MKEIVITAGEKYVDIDALACAVAYKELLEKQGKNASVVFPGKLNHSVSRLIKERYDFEVKKELPSSIEGYVVVDVSEPSHIAAFVQPKEVISIFDHHYGFKDFWEEEIGKENTSIEMIGACATLIWEEFKRYDMQNDISRSSASLLAIAIISNTFNLGVSLTSERDIQAYKELLTYADLPENWKETYFNEQEEEVFIDTQSTITNDTKIQEIPNLKRPLIIGQIELWDGEKFINEYIDEVRDNLKQYNNPYWMMNVPSISQKKNYIYTESDEVKNLLNRAMGWNFQGHLYETDKLILRKEILKELYNLEI